MSEEQVDAALESAIVKARWQARFASMFELGGRIGRDVYYVDAATLRLHWQFASCREGFGFTKEHGDAPRRWPALTLVVEFPVGREALRDELAVRVAKVVSEFLAEHKLDRELPTQTKGDTE